MLEMSKYNVYVNRWHTIYVLTPCTFESNIHVQLLTTAVV